MEAEFKKSGAYGREIRKHFKGLYKDYCQPRRGENYNA